MKESFYFSHDSDATDDPKIMILISQWGLEAYGIFWTIIEHLRKQPDYISHLSILKALAQRYGSTEEKYKFVVFDFGLFTIIDNVNFCSDSLIRRMKPLEDKREYMRQLANKRWEKQHASALPAHDDTQSAGNAIKVKKRKGKEIKKYIPPKDFYDLELRRIENNKSEEADNYRLLIDFLFGKNELRRELTGVLSIREQMTFEQFCDIITSKTSEERIGSLLIKMENDPKYYKSKSILYATLKTWVTERFKK